jgi:hypothetical protein
VNFLEKTLEEQHCGKKDSAAATASIGSRDIKFLRTND